MASEHTHTECDYCGMVNFKCRRWHSDLFKDDMCGRCESYERGDIECFRVGAGEDEADEAAEG